MVCLFSSSLALTMCAPPHLINDLCHNARWNALLTARPPGPTGYQQHLLNYYGRSLLQSRGGVGMRCNWWCSNCKTAEVYHCLFRLVSVAFGRSVGSLTPAACHGCLRQPTPSRHTNYIIQASVIGRQSACRALSSQISLDWHRCGKIIAGTKLTWGPA